jgi:UDP-2,4-diacetamido-2,4,6-trideoxy-beta-L-altropyranose hydrolase
MQVFFRVDSSQKIGTGHVMRCLALAEELRTRGSEITFFSRDLSGNISDSIKDREFNLKILKAPKSSPSRNENYLDWLEVSVQEDQKEMLSLVKGATPTETCLVVDHYALDSKWEAPFKKLGLRILVIDDLANRNHDCNLLMDQNYFSDPQTRYRQRVSSDCQLYLGPEFSLLRKEFQTLGKTSRNREKIEKLLVFFGGIDLTGETEKTLQALSLLKNQIQVDLIIGSKNPNREKIENLAKNLKTVKCHVQTPHLAKLMFEADLALGAGGSSTWERCCMGLPSFVISVAENQTETSAQMGKRGYSVFLGSHEEVSAKQLAAALDEAISQPKKILEMGKKSRELVDGMGCAKIASALLKQS